MLLKLSIPYLYYFSFGFCILFLSTLLPNSVHCAFNDEEDSDQSAINVRTYENFKVNAEIENGCDLRVMRAYSMYGDATSLSQPNLIFPSIKQNCCGPRDQENIKALWRKSSRQIVKNQKYFLYLVKGVLSQSQDFLRLATHGSIIYDRIKNKKYSLEAVKRDYPGLSFYQGDLVWHNRNYKVLINSEFIELAEKIKNGMDTSKLKIMYHGFNQAAEFMMNVRRSFYSMICSVEGQLACSRKGFLKRVFYFNDIFYGTPFCEAMISHHFKYFYDYYYFVKRLQRFVDRLPFFVQITTEFEEGKGGILQGGGGPGPSNAGNTGTGGADYVRKGITIPYGHFLYGSPAYDHFMEHYDNEAFNLLDTLSVQACSQFSNFTACEFYCQEFSMVKHVDYFDGTPELLLNTFRTMMAMRDQFDGFRENEFEVDWVTLEKMIDELKEKYNPYIYVSTMPSDIEFNNQGNDFSELVGFNPLEAAAGCTLDLTFQHVSVLRGTLLLALAWLFFKAE